jgi:molecular chaperone GrpE
MSEDTNDPQTQAGPTAELQAELELSKDRYLRLLADFENFRRRMGEELAQSQERGRIGVLQSLIPLLDDLERALEFAQSDPESIAAGVRQVRDSFVRALAGLGVEPVPGKGSAFDPQCHEAIGVMAADEDEGHVAEVYQKGYRLGNQLIRPARVAVSQKKAEAD